MFWLTLLQIAIIIIIIIIKVTLSKEQKHWGAKS